MLTILKKTNLKKDFAHSYILNILRGIAALQVCIHHFRNHFYPSYNDIINPSIAFKAFAFATGFANHAVMIFFAISGWLVGGSVLNNIHKKNFAINYTIDRTTRLWTVLLPTFIISFLIINLITYTELANEAINREHSLSFLTFIGNLFGLQTVLVGIYAGNYPLWSLANESWYYFIFPLIVYILTASNNNLNKLLFATILGVIFIYLPQKITYFFIVWLLGALISRIKLNITFLGKLILIITSLSVMLFSRYKNMHNDLNMIIMYIVPLLLFISANQQHKNAWMLKNNLINKSVNFFSEISFSLYVIHVPFIYLSHSIYISYTGEHKLKDNSFTDTLIFASLIISIIAITALFNKLFEQKHLKIRHKIKNLLLKKQI